MKSKYFEIERKYTYSEKNWDSFVKLCHKYKPIKSELLEGPDTYYENSSGEVLRFRISDDLCELTVKSRHSKSSTLIRDEVDLNIKKNSIKTILKFIKSLGFKKLFRIRKTCHLFWFEDKLGTLNVTIYKIPYNGTTHTYVEIEPEKGLDAEVAKKLINKWEKKLDLAPWRRLNKTLLEIFSNKETKLKER